MSAASVFALIEEHQRWRSPSELWHQMEKLLCVLLPWQQQAHPAFPSVAEPGRRPVCSRELWPSGISHQRYELHYSSVCPVHLSQ